MKWVQSGMVHSSFTYDTNFHPGYVVGMVSVVAESRRTEFVEQIVALAGDKSVVWDFDGVIADTEPLQDASYRILAERRAWELPDGYFSTLIGRTEDDIWELLFAQGFPHSTHQFGSTADELKAERKVVFSDLAHAGLRPSWLAQQLMPALHKVASEQIIVSNGDPDIIESLIGGWGLVPYVEIARRSPGTDKAALLGQRCGVGSILLEDNAGWLARGKALGATTVGVVHGYNSVDELDADFFVEI
jgi:phosphoglycolate phosphatase-like HAD superfamily hydrolase